MPKLKPRTKAARRTRIEAAALRLFRRRGELHHDRRRRRHDLLAVRVVECCHSVVLGIHGHREFLL